MYIDTIFDSHNKCTKSSGSRTNPRQYCVASHSHSENKANIFVSVFTNDNQSPLPSMGDKPILNIMQLSVDE